MLIWKLFHYSRKFIILLYTHSLFVILIIKIRYDFCNYYITLIFFFLRQRFDDQLFNYQY